MMHKFRTMISGAEMKTGPVMSKPGDPRVTGIGRYLRKFSIDELPQIVNVLLGEMSLIGPRPEREVFVEKFREKMPKYMLRHKVKSGMTGWAQVHGLRQNTDFEKFIRGYFSPFDYSIILGYGLNIRKDISAGASLKVNSENIQNFSGINFSADMGFSAVGSRYYEVTMPPALSPYWTLSAGARYNISRYFGVYFNASNLLSEEYEPVYGYGFSKLRAQFGIELRL